MSGRRSTIPADSLLQLLDRLPPKSPELAPQITTAVQLYDDGLSRSSSEAATRIFI